MARRISKASKRRLIFFGIPSVIAIFCCISSFIYNIYIIRDLTIEKQELQKEYASLVEEAKQLKLDIDKLNDPEYLADYARENYLYSKENEYIIQIGEEITETTETIDSIELNIDRNYVLLGLTFAIISIFIYILLKSKKGNKK